MVPSRSFNAALAFLFLLVVSLSCVKPEKSFPVHPEKHQSLSGKRIFLDPGHGGLGDSDPFRVGPGGVTEEEVNLRVALILKDLLVRCGADVMMSRDRDRFVSLDNRVEMARGYKPDILVSIHHNGSPRREDSVNYPSVLIWGPREARPASYDFSLLLLEEFHKIMDEKGSIVSDFSVFRETGTRILRRTRDICPGVLGEGGFFSHCDHAIRLNDIHYNEREALAYFTALSRFFLRGIPRGEVEFSCPLEPNGCQKNMITEKNPKIYIRVKSGNERRGIYGDTLAITLDNVPVGHKRIDEDLYLVDYGRRLYPGNHRLRFSFRNLRYQSSMVYTVPFSVKISAGDYAYLVSTGKRLINSRKKIIPGLLMLQSALSMGATDPKADELLWHLSRGFRLIDKRAVSHYYLQRIYSFYPQSKLRTRISSMIPVKGGESFPVEYYGKEAAVIGAERKFTVKEFFLERLKYFFMDRRN